MKYLVVYMSHHGTTEKVAHELREQIGVGQTTLVNLDSDEVPELNDFDTIIVGGSIHVGKIQKKITAFCESNRSILLQKRLGLFLCFMDHNRGEEEFNTAFPADLRKHAIACGLFGGELIFEKMNFLEKMVIRKIKGVSTTTSEINEGAIDTFVHIVRH